MNLLHETIKALKENGKTVEDVQWVGTSDGKFAISWIGFIEIANIEYNKGYGGNEIALNLVVVGDSWWLERAEYDGYEWWEFKTLPIKKQDAKPLVDVLHKLRNRSA